MDESPLRRLPPELRIEVYEHVFHCSTGIIIDVTATEPKAGRNIFPSFELDVPEADGSLEASAKALTALEITKTCRELRHESLPVFFGANTFTFFTDLISAIENGVPEQAICMPIAKWLRQIGPSAKHLKTIELHLGEWDPFEPLCLSDPLSALIRCIDVFGPAKRTFSLALEASCPECKESSGDYQYALSKLPLNKLEEVGTGAQAPPLRLLTRHRIDGNSVLCSWGEEITKIGEPGRQVLEFAQAFKAQIVEVGR